MFLFGPAPTFDTWGTRAQAGSPPKPRGCARLPLTLDQSMFTMQIRKQVFSEETEPGTHPPQDRRAQATPAPDPHRDRRENAVVPFFFTLPMARLLTGTSGSVHADRSQEARRGSGALRPGESLKVQPFASSTPSVKASALEVRESWISDPPLASCCPGLNGSHIWVFRLDCLKCVFLTAFPLNLSAWGFFITIQFIPQALKRPGTARDYSGFGDKAMNSVSGLKETRSHG